MQQLKTTKAKSVIVPQMVKRFFIVYWDKNTGWQVNNNPCVNPETAIQNFIEIQNRYQNNDIEFYKCVEIDLEIPFLPKK